MDTFNTRVLSFIKNIETNCYAGEEEKEALIFMLIKKITMEWVTGNKEQKDYLERCHGNDLWMLDPITKTT